MGQLTLFSTLGIEEEIADKANYIVDSFSADNFCPEEARQALEEKYKPILEITRKLDRRSVSYQLSKKDALHSWLKYKEGFSADLVNILLDDMGAVPGDTVMDPFMGSGTTALVCQMRGINSIGYDIMPISGVSISAKANVMKYDISELQKLIGEFSDLQMPEDYSGRTPYITITDTAYPDFNEKFIQYATEWISTSSYSPEAKNLFTLCMINSLERCSYTSKSGQYLSWDSRSKKVINANKERAASGRKLLPEHHCREIVENIKDAVIDELKVEAIIILPRELFITTDISVTLWILNQNKKGGAYHGRMLRSRAGEILFIDLRTWTENTVKNESKKKVLLSSEQIQKAADIFHTWQSEGTDGANYAVPELYRSVSKDEIEKQGWSLVPSKYIEFIDHDLEIDYAAEMSRIQKEMREVLKQEMKSQKMLEDAFRGIGYDIE